MVDFNVNVDVINGNNIVGAQVTIQEGSNVESIEIVDEEALNNLLSIVNRLNDKNDSSGGGAVTYNDLVNAINSKTGVNADTVDGKHASDFSLSTHNHNSEYANISHAQTNTNHGVGTASLYGHNKVINNLNTPSHSDGVSLSAYQGKVLNDKLNRDRYQIILVRYNTSANTFDSENNYQVNIASSVARVACIVRNKWTGELATELSGVTIGVMINGVLYERTINGDGVTGTISFNLTEYTLVQARLKAGNDYNASTDIKYYKKTY